MATEKPLMKRLFQFEVPMKFSARLGLSMLVPLVTGPDHFNWAAYQLIYLAGGMFKSACKTDEKVIDFQGIDTCASQLDAVNNIFTIAVAFHFGCSFVGGFINDKLPPKMAIITGLALRALGYILLSLSTSNVILALIGAAMVGLGQDWGYMPMLSLTNYAPERSGLIIASMGSCRSISYLVPIMINLLVPHLGMPLALGGSHVVLCSLAIGAAFLALPELSMAEKQGIKETRVTGDGKTITAGPRLSTFLMAPRFLALVPYGLISILRPTFLNSIVGPVLKNTLPYFTILGAFSFLPCPLLGYMVDKYGVFIVMHIVNGAGLLSGLCMYYLYSIQDSQFMEWMFILTHNLAMSFVGSQLHCYFKTQFPANYVGTLAGVICFFIGAGALSNSLSFKAGQNMGFGAVTLYYVGASVVGAVLIVGLSIAARRRSSKGTALPG